MVTEGLFADYIKKQKGLDDCNFVLPLVDLSSAGAPAHGRRSRRRELSAAELSALVYEGTISKNKKQVAGSFVVLATVGQAARVVRNRQIAARSLASIKSRLVASEKKRDILRVQEMALQKQLEELLRAATAKEQ